MFFVRHSSRSRLGVLLLSSLLILLVGLLVLLVMVPASSLAATQARLSWRLPAAELTGLPSLRLFFGASGDPVFLSFGPSPAFLSSDEFVSNYGSGVAEAVGNVVVRIEREDGTTLLLKADRMTIEEAPGH